MSTDYEFSRIFAQGWNAALKLTRQQQALLDARGAGALNPYIGEGRERRRWTEGFERALDAAPHAAGRKGRIA